MLDKWFSKESLQWLLEKDLWMQIGIGAAITLVLYWILLGVIGFATRRLKSWKSAERSKFFGVAVEMLGRTNHLLLFIFSMLISVKFVELPEGWRSAISHGWFIALALQVALWVDGGIRLWLNGLLTDTKTIRNPVTATIVGIMLRILVWAMMLLSILANMGVNISALVASLGVGGIAVALAVQTLLSDLFASLSIGFDKPFEIGDFVVFNDIAGTIEHIGLRTTRIRSLSGEQVVLANNILLQQTIHNYKRMNERRIVFKFGVTYSTPRKKVAQIGNTVKSVIESLDHVRFDRAHFFAFDDYQLTFEVVYFVTQSDYLLYMDVQQNINLALMEAFEKDNIEFAFPTQSVEFIGGQLPELRVAGLPTNAS